MSCKTSMAQFYITKPHLLRLDDSLEVDIGYIDVPAGILQSLRRVMGFKVTLTRLSNNNINIQLTAKHPESEEDYEALSLELPLELENQNFVHFGFISSINPLYHVEGSENNYRFRESNTLFASQGDTIVRDTEAYYRTFDMNKHYGYGTEKTNRPQFTTEMYQFKTFLGGVQVNENIFHLRLTTSSFTTNGCWYKLEEKE